MAKERLENSATSSWVSRINVDAQRTVPPVVLHEKTPEGTFRIDTDGTRTKVDTTEPGFFQAARLRYHP